MCEEISGVASMTVGISRDVPVLADASAEVSATPSADTPAEVSADALEDASEDAPAGERLAERGSSGMVQLSWQSRNSEIVRSLIVACGEFAILHEHIVQQGGSTEP